MNLSHLTYFIFLHISFKILCLKFRKYFNTCEVKQLLQQTCVPYGHFYCDKQNQFGLCVTTDSVEATTTMSAQFSNHSKQIVRSCHTYANVL